MGVSVIWVYYTMPVFFLENKEKKLYASPNRLSSKNTTKYSHGAAFGWAGQWHLFPACGVR
jgi:hypothetical protein